MNELATRRWIWTAAGRRAIQVGSVAVVLAGAGWSQVVKAPRYQSGMTTAAPASAATAPASAAITPGGTVVEDVVVRVNDQIISRSDLERGEQQMYQESEQQHDTPAQLAERQKDMLRDMIDQQLLLSRAKELGLNADAEVIRRLDDIRKQNKLDTMEDLEKAAKSQGVSFEDFKAQIRNGILTQQVVRDEVGRKLQMSQAEETAYYNAHKAEYTQPEQIRLSEILVPVSDTAPAATVSQAQAKANDIKSKIMAGGKFDELAKQYSGGPTASAGGDLGLFKSGALAKVLEDQTFGLKAGESTQPIRTRQGYVILEVTEHVPAGTAPIKEVEPQIQEALYMAQMQPALRAYLTKLREEAYIDIKPGFVDSGASPNETKPVFSAYAPPAVKKKKETQTARYGAGARPGAKPVISSPDTTGGRTLTGADAETPVVAAKPVDPNTGMAVIAPQKTSRSGKSKKIHREKVRFGQAPRNSLPAGPSQTVAAGDIGGATSLNTGSGTTATAGSAMASLGTAPVLDNPENPLAPKAAPLKKTRFAARPDVPKVSTAKALSAKKAEKVSATPVALTQEEKSTAQVQDSPLGLNGDTARKKAKAKRKKGDPKVRLEDKPKETPAVAPEIAPTANPALAPTADTPPSTTAPKS